MSLPATSGGSRVSMFAGKAGFVIPKNKLSGSLVPVFGGVKKTGSSDAGNEDNVNSVQRRTKWGPDLRQDAAVRKARALAYETRLEQITKQLKAGTLDTKGEQELPMVLQEGDKRASDSQPESEKMELLELERREIIGEILKLNPKYKAPADYKPLMKEAKVSIPLKEHPEYNFVSLIFGPEGLTQKRLEKETGAKIHVYGTKSDTGEKVEITSRDGKRSQDSCDDLYVNVSALTYDRVDEAVAVIEMLFTSVLGNLGAASGSASDSSDANAKKVAERNAAPSLNFTQALEGPLRYADSWPKVPPPTSQTGVNSSSPLLINPTPSNPSITQSASTMSPFSPHPVPESNAVLTNPAFPPNSQPRMPVFQSSFAPPPPNTLPVPSPQNAFIRPNIPVVSPHSMPAPPTSLVRPNIPVVSPHSDGPSHLQGPLVSARPSNFLRFQAESGVPPRPGQFSDHMTSNWPAASARPPSSLGSSHMGPHQLRMLSSSAPSSMPLSSAMNRPTAPTFSGGLSDLVGPVHSVPPNRIGPMLGSGSISGPVPLLHTSAAGGPLSVGNASPRSNLPITGPKPYLNDFTFQPPPRPNVQLAPPRPMMQAPPPPQVPPYRFSPSNPASRSIVHPLSRPQLGNQMGQTFASNPHPVPLHPRHMAFHNAGPPVRAPVSPMGARDFPPAFPRHNFTSFPPRPSHRIQYQSFTNFNTRPQNGNMNSSGQQVYDPFSPSDV